MKKTLIYIIAIILLAVTAFFMYQEIYSRYLTHKAKNEKNFELGNDTPSSILAIDCSTVKDFLNRSISYPENLNNEIRTMYIKRLTDLIAGLKNNCNQFNSWIDLGLNLNAINDFRGAKLAWETASSMDPDNFLPYHNLGNLYGFSLKDIAMAEKYYFMAINKNINSLNSFSDLADLYLYNNQPQKSLDFLNDGMKKAMFVESEMFFLQKIAFIYDQIGDNANVLKYYEQLYAKDPSNELLKQEIERLKVL